MYVSQTWVVLWFSDESPRMHLEGSRRRLLGEQVLYLINDTDRLAALRRATAAMQVTLARAIVLRALASIAVRYTGFVVSWWLYIELK